MFTRKCSTLIVGVVLFLLVSCGGSGSDGVVVTPPPANLAALPITAANAQGITANVLVAVVSTIDIIDILNIIGPADAQGQIPGLAKFAVNAIIPRTVACDTGNAAVEWNDADNNLEVSTGDTFDIDFNMCFFSDSGTTLDGPTLLTNLVIAGDPLNRIAPWALELTFGFDNLSGTDSSGTVIVDGDVNLDYRSDDNIVENISITTASLTTQTAGITETLSDYVLTQTFDINALTLVLSANGILTSTLLEGSVTFETLEDFTGTFDDNPSAGQMLISDSGSSVLVTVLDNISVQLDIDFDLDGTIDETIVVTWAELNID
ncbi:MAG: hypothetical protein WBM64_12730 [Woeseiaceae bacterium]